MNEEQEQSDENQEQLLEQLDVNQERLIEIYKLQSQLADNISNRRTSIHKFYLLLMSGLALIFPTFFKLPTEIRSQVSIEFLVVGMALLGIPLTIVWFILINSNLRQSMVKYEALKRLEDKLDYQFFRDEWTFLERYGKSKAYWEITYIEIFIPILFFLIFTFLLNAASVNYPDNIYFALISLSPSIITGYFCAVVLGLWQIDKDIRGVERWTKGKTSWVSYAIMGAFILIFTLFRMGYRGAVNKEAETIIKKPAETTSDKPTETSSEQTTTEKVIPDGKEQNGSQ